MRTRLLLLLFVAAAFPLQAQTPKPVKPTKPAETPARLAKPAETPVKPVRPVEAPAATPARKTLTFQPGAKTPDEAAEEAAAAAATSVAPPGSKTFDPCLELATTFFESLKRGLIDDAYANLTKGSKIGDRPEELRSLKSKTSEAISLFGEIRGFEVIESKVVGSTLRRYTIVSFGRDFPLRWRFYFYKAEEQWRLVDLHVDDRLNGIFQEQEETAEAKQ